MKIKKSKEYNYAVIWVRPATRNLFKKMAAEQGENLIDFMAKLAEKLLKVKK